MLFASVPQSVVRVDPVYPLYRLLTVGTDTYDSSAAVYVFTALTEEETAEEEAAEEEAAEEEYNDQEASANTRLAAPPLRIIPRKLSKASKRSLGVTSSWTEVAKFTPKGPAEFTGYGSAVSLHKSSVTNPVSLETIYTTSIAVGSPAGGPKADGQVYVYTSAHSSTPDSITWGTPGTKEQMLTASNRHYDDMYGCSVDISADVLAVGAKNQGEDGSQTGAVYLYSHDTHHK